MVEDGIKVWVDDFRIEVVPVVGRVFIPIVLKGEGERIQRREEVKVEVGPMPFESPLTFTSPLPRPKR
jgi:hypothetical protein